MEAFFVLTVSIMHCKALTCDASASERGHADLAASSSAQGSLGRRMTGCCGDGTVATQADEEGMSRKGTEGSEALNMV